MKLESSKHIVQKIIRDLDISQLGWVEDVNDWVKEALEYIGTNHNKILVKKDFEVETGEISLPCNLVDLIGIVQNGCFLTFQSETGLLTPYDSKGNIRPYKSGVNKIKFNSDKVKGTIIYYSYIQDCEDELLFDGHIKIKEAITNYIVMRLLVKGYKHPVLSYKEAYDLWINSKNVATNYGLLPAPYEVPFILSEYLNPLEA